MGTLFRFYYDRVYSDSDQRDPYEQILTAARRGDEYVHFKHASGMGEGDNLTESISTLVNNVVSDDPSLFWLYPSFTYWKIRNSIKLKLTYRYSKERYERERTVVQKEIDNLISQRLEAAV